MKLMSHATARFARSLLVMLTMAAWFSISNHCTLGGLIAIETKSAAVPMHCHGCRPAPAKSGDEQTPCCKVLKAIKVANVNLGTDPIGFAFKEYSSGKLVVEIWQASPHTPGLNTGPPRALSFSESVLQRSILAHAPPLSLS
jgi:hypothetical protein